MRIPPLPGAPTGRPPTPAITAGWSDAQQTSRDPDLAPLRDRDDFRRPLAEVFDRGFPTDPFAL